MRTNRRSDQVADELQMRFDLPMRLDSPLKSHIWTAGVDRLGYCWTIPLQNQPMGKVHTMTSWLDGEISLTLTHLKATLQTLQSGTVGSNSENCFLFCIFARQSDLRRWNQRTLEKLHSQDNREVMVNFAKFSTEKAELKSLKQFAPYVKL